MTYDATGNITSRSDVAAGASWTYDPTHKHEVTQAGSSSYQYSYDANGNAITRQGSTIAWSSYNYPTTVNAGSGSTAESASFNYGPARQRWQQSYSGNSTTEVTDYVGGLLEVVTGGGITDYRHYINAGGENVAVYSRKNNGTSTFSYLLSDHQASAASVTNSSGTQVVGESFDAFGSRRNPSTWSGAPSNSDLTTIAGITREGYTFQTALGLWMGLNHMNGRVEDSITGRFLSADPKIPDRTNAQSYNRYSYLTNNPLSYADPSGFSCPQDANGKCLPPNWTYNGNPNYGLDVISSSWGPAAFYAGAGGTPSDAAIYSALAGGQSPQSVAQAIQQGAQPQGSVQAAQPAGISQNSTWTNAENTLTNQLYDDLPLANPGLNPIDDPIAAGAFSSSSPGGVIDAGLGNFAAWEGVVASAGDYSSGTLSIGTNFEIYAAAQGNRYFTNLVGVSTLFRLAGVGGLILGTFSDVEDAFNGTGSFSQAGFDATVGGVGFLNPIVGVPATLYLTISHLYPGGPRAYNAAFSQSTNVSEGGAPE